VPELDDPRIRNRIEACLAHRKVSGEVILKSQPQAWIRGNLGNFTVAAFKEALFAFVHGGGRVDRVQEEREGYEQDAHYDVRFGIHGQRIYVEMVFEDESNPNSRLVIVNVHEQ
jgi:hypothetical protein